MAYAQKPLSTLVIKLQHLNCLECHNLNNPLNNNVRYDSPSNTYPSAVAASFAMTWSTDPINIFSRIQNASLALKHQIHVPPVETDVAVCHQWWQSPVRAFDGGTHKHVPIKVAYIIWTIKNMLTADETGVSPFGVPFTPMFIHLGQCSFIFGRSDGRRRATTIVYVCTACVHVCLRAPSEPCKFTYGIIIMCVLLVGRFILLTVLMCAAMMIWWGRARYGRGVESELLLPHDDDGRMSGSFITVGVGL